LKVLVTGAAGFLGRWFVADHLNRGDDVTGIDDMSNPFSQWPEALKLDHRREMDIVSYFRVSELRRPVFDLAYHFAAPVGGRKKIEEDPLFNAGSLGLDAAFFRWATQHAHIAVYPSSSAVYPIHHQTSGAHHALQEGLFNPSDARDIWGKPDEVYGLTKLVGEVLAWKSAAYGLRTLCIRPFSGYGEDQGLDYPMAAIAQRAAMGEDPIKIWGSGSQTRDFVHVSDIVGATQARLAEGIYGGYAAMNIGSGVATSFRTIAEKLAILAGYDPEITTDPEQPEGVRHRYADVEEMERYYRPRVSLNEGLNRLLEYRRAQLRSHA
jgi:nucleoside-diphosphate-sugar epimerase